MSRLGFGLFVTIGFLVVAAIAPHFVPGSALSIDLDGQLALPSLQHWFGRNHLGQDLLGILLRGSTVSVGVGLFAVFVSAGLGIPLGLWAGYRGGVTDRLLSWVTEVVLSFPGMLLAIAIAAVLGPSPANVVFALAIGGWVPFSRVVRAQVQSLRSRDFVRAAVVLGASESRILFRHILPQLWGPIVVQATFAMAAAILAESSLSFLGLGSPVGTPSWGIAVSDGVRYLLQAPHLATFPGAAIMLSVMAFNFLGDGLKDRLHEVE